MSAFQSIRPCPVCGGTRDCRIQGFTGTIHCHHSGPNDSPNGYYYDNVDREGFSMWRPTVKQAINAHTRAKINAHASAKRVAKKTGEPFVADPLFADILTNRRPMTDDEKQRRGNMLSLPVDSGLLTDTQVWTGHHGTQFGPAWVTPERDADERIIGFTRRYFYRFDAAGEKIGKKAAGQRGLIIPTCWRDLPGPLLLVEGESDTEAASVMDLAAIGRPSATGGVELLGEYLRLHAADLTGRAIVVIGENDRKADGSWPGRDGAERTAAKLAEALGRQVLVCLPPAHVKDVRGLIESRRAELLANLTSLAEVSQDLLDHVAATCYNPPASVEPAQIVAAAASVAVAELPRPLGDRTAADFEPPADAMPPSKALEKCPQPKGVLMRCDCIRTNRVMWVDCRQLKCPYCHLQKRAQYKATVQTHLASLRKSNVKGDTSEPIVNQFWVESQDWNSVSRRLRSSHASYFCLKADPSLYLVVSTELPAAGGVRIAEKITADVAARRLTSAITNLFELRPKILTYSRDWNLVGEPIKRKDNRWRRVAKISAPQRAIFDVLEFHKINWRPVGQRGSYWGWIAWEWADGQSTSPYDRVHADVRTGEVLPEFDFGTGTVEDGDLVGACGPPADFRVEW